MAIRLRYKPTYDRLQVLIINIDVRKLLARKNANGNPIWSWNESWLTARLPYPASIISYIIGPPEMGSPQIFSVAGVVVLVNFLCLLY